MFAELSPPYATIVADPPWPYPEGWPPMTRSRDKVGRKHLDYSSMSLDEIVELPVTKLVTTNAHLYLWTTNRYLRDSYRVAEAWGFKPSQVLVWCKSPRGIGTGGAFSNTTEFVLFCRRGTLKHQQRVDSSWWHWTRGLHSEKPAAFGDLVERVSPGPYLELFARTPRLGWDSWGKGYESAVLTGQEPT